MKLTPPPSESGGIKLFVPGRVCLLGEHSDWAGGYRFTHPEIEKGYAILAGTNQGIEAVVKPHPTHLIVHATTSSGEAIEPLSVPMKREALREVAAEGGFYSYIAGVAYHILTHFQVGGIEIHNHRTTLPTQKGVSSSAAICVLTARGFNRLYHLNMSVRGEMEYAYLGETATPSQCGRMDQGCAFGSQPVLMTFDGQHLDVEPLSVPNPIYLVLVDLCAHKDTKEILASLQTAFPTAQTEQHKAAQTYLGSVNKQIVHRGVNLLQSGDASGLGQLMREAQEQFDRALKPLCPSQLTAPKLHQVLAYEPIQSLIYGGKGVGSQGDGTAQLVAKSEEAQLQIVEVLERDLQVSCLTLTLRSERRVKKAIIPAAGYGSRMFPASRAMRKEFFPVVDATGRAKPSLLVIVEEAYSAGISEICIVAQPGEEERIQKFFQEEPPPEQWRRMKEEDRSTIRYLQTLGEGITVLPQNTQEGLGHAVHCASSWLGKEPALLLLGDHLFSSTTSTSCAQQMLSLYEQTGQSVVGLIETPAEQISHFGAAAGTWVQDLRHLQVTTFLEKPTLEEAQQHLQVEGLPADTYLTFFGQYVLTPALFDLLAEAVQQGQRERGEVELTTCLKQLLAHEGCSGLLVQGKRFDIGNPTAYRQTLAEFQKEGT